MQQDILVKNNRALLIGAGSIGKRHLSVMSKKFKSIVIVDTDQKVYKYLQALPNFASIEFVNKLTDIKNPSEIDLAVISNWGPDHSNTFLELVNSGVKNFIIEKPLADSFRELDEMQTLIDAKKLNVKTNLSMIYSGIPIMLREFENLYSIGEVQSIFVYGGAKCVATIGIHYVALANHLFNDRPLYVNAFLKSDDINPRDSALVYLEGNASWVYPNNRHLTVNFINSSQIDIKCTLIYKHAEVLINGDTLTLSKIPNSSLMNLDKPTKTSRATEQLFSIEINLNDNLVNSLETLYDSVSKSEHSQKKDIGFAATYDLLSALVASEMRQTLTLSGKEDFSSTNYKRKWGIS